jgi:superfamily II DNA or RNA helicase
MSARGVLVPATVETIMLSPKKHAAPICESFGDETNIVRFEREVRVHRAHVEEFAITKLGDDAFVVKGKSGSGAEYLVDIVDGLLFDTCTCPDFLGNRLGTCKHVEAVKRIDIGKRPRSDAQDVLTVRADGKLRLVRLGQERADARVTHAALVAEKMLRVREESARRAEAIDAALRDGSLELDVLSKPLFPYQRDGVAHLVRAGRAVLADDMGLGKTVQTIAACEVLRRRGEAKRVLVVCPASLKAQWAQEIARYAGEKAVVVLGSAKERREVFASDAPYIVLNYELTWRDLSILEALKTDVLVLDEAQRARNFRTKTAATLKRIPSRFLFVLTGTPVENKLDDLYGIMQLVEPEVLGPLWKFNVDFHVQDEVGIILKVKNLGELRRRLEPWVLRRKKKDVLSQLPALVEQTRYVPLTTAQADLEAHYRRRAAQLVAIQKKRPLTPAERTALTGALLKARQACNAAQLCDPKSPDDQAPKLDELEALVGELTAQGSNVKLLVFSEWTEMLKLAAARLDEVGVGWSFLHGGIPTPQRPKLLEEWRKDPKRPVLLSTDAGGVGLNLQDASYVVHLDLPWNPARIDQRVSRAHRLGQTRGVLVTYLCADTGIERELEGTLQTKREMRSAAVDADSEVEEMEAARMGVASIIAVDDKKRAREARDALDRAHQRLRLAKIVVDAGYADDAIRAAQEAIGAAATALEEDAPLLAPGTGAGDAIAQAEQWVDRADRSTSKRK